ncbi:hypothetical protein E8E14_009237 [Neopestalotiopsis sp. 37M]|nr:hypothetical protein E8E14_009237 [Neopestalotiopsis sp. 37M]
MFKSIVTWALLATSAVYAAPVQEISARDLFKGLADFERLSTTSLGTSPIGYYGGLQFNGLAAVTAGTRRLLSGLAPRSGTNVAAFGNVTKGLSSPVITSEFAGSKTGNFTLSSLFFGCVDSSNKPVGCKLAVSGYDKRGVLVVYQPFYFTPSGGALNNLSPAYFNNFVGLSYVKFAATFVGGVLGSVAIDDISYYINTLPAASTSLTTSISLPTTISLPTILPTLPTSLPSISLPTTLPTLPTTLPSVTLPTILPTLPTSLPSVTLPTILPTLPTTLPSVTLPTIVPTIPTTLPSVTLPTILPILPSIL